MTDDDVQMLIKTLAAEVRGYVCERVAEARAMMLEHLASAIAALPKPRDGIDGQNGKDAPEIDAEALTLRILARIEPQLQPGPQGLQGPKGDPGEKGESVDKAELRAEVREDLDELVSTTLRQAIAELPTPRDGTDGQDGQDGKEGPRGEPGRDALQVEILPKVDYDRCYARGTYAYAFGGLVRASRATDPWVEGESLEKCGWDCVINGIQSVHIRAIDGRRFEFVALTAKGIQRSEFSVPSVIDRGVFKSGVSYEQGDLITHDGSGWIAQEATSDLPGTSKTWRMLVRKGRDGRDGTLRSEPSREPVRLK